VNPSNNNMVSLEDVLKAANHGNIPSISNVVNHWIHGGISGYELVISIIVVLSVFVCFFGIILVLFGLVANDSKIKRWGWGNIAGTFLMTGFSVMVPIIVEWIRGHVMPH
jgi:hypothetical protein